MTLGDGRVFTDPPLLYVGEQDGLHVWEVCLETDIESLAGTSVEVGIFPAKTTMQFPLTKEED